MGGMIGFGLANEMVYVETNHVCWTGNFWEREGGNCEVFHLFIHCLCVDVTHEKKKKYG